MEEGILEKTGKPLEHWVKLVNKQKFEKHGEMVKFLKTEHEFTHGYANFVAHKAREVAAGGAPAGDDLITAQYEKKPELKPVYDALIKKISEFGKDIEIAPKKNSVSLKVKRQFALIQPSTKTRIDLGLKFNNKPVGGRLESSGPFGTMCTHRVQLTDVKQVDKELIDLIKEAYKEAK